MSISSTVKTIMPYLKTASGYVLHRLSSQAVEMNDGTTLEQKVTSLNSLISKKVDTILISFEEARKNLPNAKNTNKKQS